MKLALLVIGLLALCACTPKSLEEGPFVDPQFANLIPADTTLLMGVSVERLVQTPVYQKYLNGFPIPAFEQFGQRTGIDPEKKLWQVLFVSNGKSGYWVGRGKFSDELMAPDFTQPGMKRFGYKGLTFFGTEQKSLVLFNSSTAGIGDTSVLRTVVDQRIASIAPPVKLAALQKQIPHDVQVWAVWAGGAVDVALPGNLSNLTRVMQSMESATMYLDLTTNVKGIVSGTAVSDRAAEDVQGAIQSLLALTGAKNAALFNGIQVTRQGRAVQIKVDAPPETLGLLLR